MNFLKNLLNVFENCRIEDILEGPIVESKFMRAIFQKESKKEAKNVEKGWHGNMSK